VLSSSGAPKRIEGIKSKNVLEIESEIMKTNNTGFEDIKKIVEREIIITKTVFGCMPGIRPVIKPKNIPNKTESKISTNTLVNLSVDLRN